MMRHTLLLVLAGSISLTTLASVAEQVEAKEPLSGDEVVVQKILDTARRRIERSGETVRLALRLDVRHPAVSEAIGRLTEVTELKLVAPFVDADMAYLANLTNLTRLSLTNVVGEPRITDAGVAHLAKLEKLQHLELISVNLTNEGMRRLAGLTELQTLCIWADFHPKQVTDEGLVHLSGLKKLEAVCFQDFNLSDGGFRHLAKLPKLRWIYIGRSRLLGGPYPITGRAIALLKGKELTFLGLDRCNISDADLNHLQNLPNLVSVSLDGSPISDSGAQTLGRLAKLEYINLSATKVTNRGLEHLAAITELRRLELSNTHVTDAGLVHLSGLKNLELLGVLDTAVTEEGVNELKESLPKCTIATSY